MKKIAILGAGMMGSALAVPLVDTGHEVHLVGTHLDEAIIESLSSTGRHPTLKATLPPTIVPHLVGEAEAVISDCDVLVLGVSSAGVRWAARTAAPALRPDIPVLSIAKGLEWNGSGLDILPDVFDAQVAEAGGASAPSSAVAGPCIAGELAARVPSCVVLTGRDSARVGELAALFDVDYYQVRTSADPVGAEVCAALKNAYALGVGFVAGVHERGGGARGSVAMHNLAAATYAQALCETLEIVGLLGGDPQTAVGLAGAGDLLVTLQGGRTSRFGRWLGLGLSLPDAVEKMEGATLECLDILAMLEKALLTWDSQGSALPPLPLARHLIDVALHGAPVALPVASYLPG